MFRRRCFSSAIPSRALVRYRLKQCLIRINTDDDRDARHPFIFVYALTTDIFYKNLIFIRCTIHVILMLERRLFTNRIVDIWNSPPAAVVFSHNVYTFKL